MAAEGVTGSDPTTAPLSRKLLGLRVMAVNALVIFGAFQILGWLDGLALKLPNWLSTVLGVPLVLAILSFLWTATAAGTDLTTHLLRDGKLRRQLLKGDQTPQQIAEEFEKSGYWLALSPLVLTGAAILVAFVVAVAVGIFLLAVSVVSRTLGG